VNPFHPCALDTRQGWNGSTLDARQGWNGSTNVLNHRQLPPPVPVSYDGADVARTPRLALLAAVAVLAGCGGGGGGDDDGGGSGNTSAAYDAAFDICAGGIQATADTYAVEPNEEAIAQIVVEQVSGGTPDEEKSAREGCLAALRKAGN
jgi:hypothetical protein